MTVRTPKFVIDYSRVEVDLGSTDKPIVPGDDIVVASAPATINGSRLDMTGYTFRCNIRPDPSLGGGDTLILAPTVVLFSSESDAVLDQWQFVLTATNTRTTLGTGTWAWEIEWVDTGGLNRTLAGGLIVIGREIAHA